MEACDSWESGNNWARFYCRWLPDTTVLETCVELALAAGMTVEEYLGTRWIDGLPAEDQKYVLKQIEALSPENPRWLAESRLQSVTGETIWVRFKNQAFFDDDGELMCVIGLGDEVGSTDMQEDSTPGG